MDQTFCEVENVDPSQHQRWLAKHNFEPDEAGRFSVDSFQGKLPVENEQLFENIKVNVSAGNYLPLYEASYDERTFVMVCGGPSLADWLWELRIKAANKEKYLVVCSNMTGAYLLENGIVPHAQFIIDPQEKKKFDVAVGKTSPQTQYWLNVACHPSVFETLSEQGIKPYGFLANFDKDGKAIQAVKDSLVPGQPGMMAIQGGTMAGLRAMNIADALGFRKMEYYGFDATVMVKDGKAKPYAYEKKRGEAIIEIFCDRCDQSFDTTLIFQRQVNEFLEWSNKLRWIDIKIIGGGLIEHYQKHYKSDKKPRNPERYTPQYEKLQRELHAKGGYGVSGNEFVPSIFHAISQLAKKHGDITVLDYGSASGNTFRTLKEKMWVPPCVTDYRYDPFVDEYSKEPDPADLVICTDVMEHVEQDCTDAVLDHIASLTKRLAFFSIALTPATKCLSDGRNAHINIRSSEYWLAELKKRFVLSEARETPNGECVLAVGMAIEDLRNDLRKRKQLEVDQVARF